MISVIMLTYNRERLAGRMIECVLSQTYADFEFIIVDNGSTDASGEIADAYAQKDARVRVIHKARGNIGSGRNAGLNSARGDWVAFVDDDDSCERDFLEFLLKLADGGDADISICGSREKTRGEGRIMDAQDALEALYWRRLYNNQFPTKLIRRELFSGVRFSERAKYDDIELMTYIISSARRVAYSGEPKYTFYRHPGNNSAWTTHHELLNKETLSEYLDVYRRRTEFLLGQFPDKAAKWRYFEWSFMLSMVEKITRLSIPGCESARAAMLAELRGNRAALEASECLQDYEREWTAMYL